MGGWLNGKQVRVKTVHVAAGIIRRDGSDEVLAVRRGYGSMRGLWEFPGGKVERGESPEDACVRELSEELRVRVTDLRAFYTVEYDYDDFHLSMECFFCSIDGGEGQTEPQRSDRQLDIRWVERRELAALEWMPADKDLVDVLVASARGEDAERGEGDGSRAAASRTASRRRAPKHKKSLLDGVDTAGLSSSETELVRRRAAVKKSMQGNKRANTKPELLVRQRLRAEGLTGYRLQWKSAPGRPDIAFPGRKVAIFVNGCFWHRCPFCGPSRPRTNAEFWEAKFARNRARDARDNALLVSAGWTVIVVWECRLKKGRLDATMEEVVACVRRAGEERLPARVVEVGSPPAWRLRERRQRLRHRRP